jgi:hypothetical protein
VSSCRATTPQHPCRHADADGHPRPPLNPGPLASSAVTAPVVFRLRLLLRRQSNGDSLVSRQRFSKPDSSNSAAARAMEIVTLRLHISRGIHAEALTTTRLIGRRPASTAAPPNAMGRRAACVAVPFPIDLGDSVLKWRSRCVYL